jgi:hypothetical protein
LGKFNLTEEQSAELIKEVVEMNQLHFTTGLLKHRWSNTDIAAARSADDPQEWVRLLERHWFWETNRQFRSDLDDQELTKLFRAVREMYNQKAGIVVRGMLPDHTLARRRANARSWKGALEELWLWTQEQGS